MGGYEAGSMSPRSGRKKPAQGASPGNPVDELTKPAERAKENIPGRKPGVVVGVEA
jgi:hypothetical protein